MNLTATNIKIQKTHHIPPYLCAIRKILIIAFISAASTVFSQQKKQGLNPGYDRREEILHEGKRYRLNNNYLTLGGGMLYSSIREKDQKVVGADFQFHVRRQHFQVGMMMSGEQFLSNNNVQAHFGYGLRKETVRANFAVFGGATFFTGVKAATDPFGNPIPHYYEGFGGYISAQAITKLTYDIGIGIEFFADYSPSQSSAGIKAIMFFSGAYRGLKQKYNPYVRAENP